MRASQITSIGGSMMTQSSGIDVVKRQEEAAEVMFADLISINSSADVHDFTADVGDEMLGTVETNELDTRREKPADAYEKYQYKDKTIRAESNTNTSEKLKETLTEIEDFEEAVTEVVAEELHISKEELEAAMEELGLTYLDLLDNSNLANLVAKLTDSESVNQLLCSEVFTNVMQQVNELGKELLNEIQMTPEELLEVQSLLEQTVLEDANEQLQMTEITDEINPVQNSEAEVVSDTEDGIKVEVEVVQIEDEADGQSDTSEENLSDDKKQGMSDMQGIMLEQTHVLHGSETIVTDVTGVTTFAEELNGFETVQTLPPHVTVSDIMEQFAEQVRVQISADTTKMQMQLNPEHLGKLYVEIIENEGAITAKIETQNLAVKEALEMQMADLKVNLSQAGVKVDSVEVTIASHEFERNLEQDANSKKQQEDAEAKSTRHRNINLNGLDELSGLMTEEETLVAKMMAEQGNSIDFTA